MPIFKRWHVVERMGLCGLIQFMVILSKQCDICIFYILTYGTVHLSVWQVSTVNVIRLYSENCTCPVRHISVTYKLTVLFYLLHFLMTANCFYIASFIAFILLTIIITSLLQTSINPKVPTSFTYANERKKTQAVCCHYLVSGCNLSNNSLFQGGFNLQCPCMRLNM